MNVISLEHHFFSIGPSTRNLKDSVDDSGDRVRLSCIHHGLKNHELNAIKCFSALFLSSVDIIAL